MKNIDTTNYGPLENLIGTWKGDKGKDIAPISEGTENNLYHDHIVFTGVGETENAESQLLSVVHYTQEVRRISDEKMIHHETGYWMWEQGSNTVMHSLAIPRGLCVLASGTFKQLDETVFEVAASLEEPDWQIIQSPFMVKNAKLKSYQQSLRLSFNSLYYSQTMLVDIYGKEFSHSDENQLHKSTSEIEK